MKKPDSLRIVRLESENVKRLQAVAIEPQGNLVVVGGKNGAGKSSVLDSIEWALGGKPDAPMPIRAGETKARIVLDLGDLVIERRFTADENGKVHSYLEVKNPDGLKYSSPQAVLDKLTGTIAFDPLRFIELKPREQVEALKTCLGVDSSEIEIRRQAAFEERTDVNRELERIKARFAGTENYPDAPEQEVSVAELSGQLQAAQAANHANETARLELDRVKYASEEAINRSAAAMQQVAEIERQLQEARTRADSLKSAAETAHRIFCEQQAEIQALVDVDTTAITEAIASAEETNRQVRHMAAKREAREEWSALEDRRLALSKAIEACDAEKAQLVAAAQMPVEGLSFDEDGISIGGIPLQQVNTAAQLKLSVALGLAQNPRLRVMLVREGSVLDEDNLAELARIADENGAQVWLERVGNSGAVSVLIEDGAVKPRLEAVAGGAR